MTKSVQFSGIVYVLLPPVVYKSLEAIKKEIVRSLVVSADESVPFVLGTDASDIVNAATVTHRMDILFRFFLGRYHLVSGITQQSTNKLMLLSNRPGSHVIILSVLDLPL